MRYYLMKRVRLYGLVVFCLAFSFVFAGAVSGAVIFDSSEGEEVFGGPYISDFREFKAGVSVAGMMGSALTLPKVSTEMDEFLVGSELSGFYLVTCNDVVATSKVEPSLMIIDVRTPEEVLYGRIPNSVAISLDKLTQRLEQLPEAMDSTIYVYCNDGIRGAYALASLRMLGYTEVYNIIGGFEAWRKAGLPVVDQQKKLRIRGLGVL